jgi:hypothetical protein
MSAPMSDPKIEYRNLGKDFTGLFVTTYYFRNADCNTCIDLPLYQTGIIHYLEVTERPEFKGWKVLIYIDAYSLQNPIFNGNTQNNALRAKHNSDWKKITEHPNTVFCVVTWPEYALKDATKIDEAILRAIRMKAFCDFPDTPVFLRDGDTLFPNLMGSKKDATPLHNITECLAIWEKTFWDEMKKLPPQTFQVASQPNYRAGWHVNLATGIKTNGCYAALTSTLGGIPQFKDGSLWKKCLEYLRANTKIVNGVANDMNKPTYIGKDEQLIIYVIVPALFPTVRFYYLEYAQVEGVAVEVTADTPFAAALKDMKQYPSPYKESLGEALTPIPPSTFKRKDDNEKTELTHLNTEMIRKCFSGDLNDLMKTIFKYYYDKISGARQTGGSRRGVSRRTSYRRGRRTRGKYCRSRPKRK